MRKFLLYQIFFVCLCQAQYRYGTTTANFLEIGISSNAVAMGEAYVSLADDAVSAYWNPAGLTNRLRIFLPLLLVIQTTSGCCISMTFNGSSLKLVIKE